MKSTQEAWIKDMLADALEAAAHERREAASRGAHFHRSPHEAQECQEKTCGGRDPLWRLSDLLLFWSGVAKERAREGAHGAT